LRIFYKPLSWDTPFIRFRIKKKMF